MKIEVFAILKDHFDKEFNVSGEILDVASLRKHLAEINPASSDTLKMCRFAINDEFVEDNHRLSSSDKIVIIPPSSGG